MTPEQQQALAIARARRRRAEAQGQGANPSNASPAQPVGAAPRLVVPEGIDPNQYEAAHHAYKQATGSSEGFEAEFNNYMGIKPKPQPEPLAAVPWDTSMEVADQYLFGLPGKASAGVNALIRAPFTDRSIGEEYSAIRDAQKRGRETYQAENPVLSTVAGIGANVAGAGGAMKAGGTFLRFAPNAAAPGAGIAARAGGAVARGAANVGDALVLNEVANFGSDRAFGENAGAAAALGAAAPVVAAGVTKVARGAGNVANMITGKANDTTAKRAVAQALIRSGKAPQSIVDDLQRAASEGQGEYALVDALGDSGRRSLNSIARNPGQARTDVVNALTDRQATQGERLSRFVAEGLDAPMTAKKAASGLKDARTAAANTNYGAARAGAKPVDVSKAIQAADDFVSPGVSGLANPGTNIADDSVEAAVKKARSYLTDGQSNVSDFDAAFRAKLEIDNMIEKASNTVKGKLIPIRNALDDALSQASPNYSAARDTFRQQSQAIEAVDLGTQAASPRVRAEDSVSQFQGMRPDQQAAFRAGYSDPLLARIDSASISTTTNKARPLMTGKAAKELPAFAAPGRGDVLMRQIGRENDMFQTANMALGGSRTADNLADMADLSSIDEGVLQQILRLDVRALATRGLARMGAAASGQNDATRQAIAKVLLERGPTRVKAELQAIQALDAADKVKRELVKRMLLGAGVGSLE
jgi:hypothetical protein